MEKEGNNNSLYFAESQFIGGKTPLEMSSEMFLRRKKTRFFASLRSALISKNLEKSKAKREEILKNRQEKLQKFRINYIPMCADEDWEALSKFYSKGLEE